LSDSLAGPFLRKSHLPGFVREFRRLGTRAEASQAHALWNGDLSACLSVATPAKERGMRFSLGIFGKLLRSLAGPTASRRRSKGAALSFAMDWARRNEVEPGD